MKTRTLDSLLSDARKNCSDAQLARYVSELAQGHRCAKCWRCACRTVQGERANTKKEDPVGISKD